jgi:hypothetical protein
VLAERGGDPRRSQGPWPRRGSEHVPQRLFAADPGERSRVAALAGPRATLTANAKAGITKPPTGRL